MPRQPSPLTVTVTVGALIGLLSIVSDHALYKPTDQTVGEVVVQYVGGTVNSLTVWFLVPFVLTHLYCRSPRQAMVHGAVFMAVAVAAYHAISPVFENPPMFGPVQPVGPEPLVSRETVILIEHLAIAVPGGLVAGLTGFLAQRRTSVLLVLVPAAAAELVRRQAVSWENPVSIAENITFVLFAVGVVGWVLFRSVRPAPEAGRPQESGPPSG